MKKSFIIAIFIALLTGCASTNPSIPWNEKLIKDKAPVRMVKDKSFTKKNAIRYIEDWAGVKGKSIVNEKYMKMVFSSIKKKCGYGKNEFIETYIVKHTNYDKGNIIEEVWLFNDPKSFRDDKISGLTIYLEYNKKTNQTTGDFFGGCHTGKGTSFTNFD